MRLLIKFEDGQGVGNQLWNYITLYNYAYYNDVETELDFKSCYKIIELMGNDEFKKFHKIYLDEDYDVYQLKADYIFEEVFYSEERVRDAVGKLNESQKSTELIWIRGVMQDVSALEGFTETPLYRFIRQCFRKESEKEMGLLLHVRGGDFLSTPSCLTRSYYAAALRVAKVAGFCNPAIVTNDIAYCDFLLPGFEIFSNSSDSPTNASHHIGGNLKDDFSALVQADCLIISNSTFAFWAAYFSDALIISPSGWFSSNFARDFSSPQNFQIRSWVRVDSSVWLLPKIKLSWGHLGAMLYRAYKTYFRLRSKYLRLCKKTDWR